MAAAQWYIARNGQKIGPFAPGELRQLALLKLLKPNEMIWTDGMAKWVEASTFAGLFPSAEQKRYWLALNGQTRGPFGIDQIRAALVARQITVETKACPEGGKEWTALAQVTEFHGVTPSAISPSQARLLSGTLDAEEAELYLAGKGGDVLARIITTLTGLKKSYAGNPALVESLDKSIEVLRARRDENALATIK